MKHLLCSLLVWALWRASAHAEDVLILFEQPALRPGLCAALRIQLTDLASVRCRADLVGSLEVRIARAAEQVARDGARLAVLLEPDPTPGPLRMLVVGAAPDRALLAVERVEARPEPDVDQALALKVRETFEVSLVAGATAAPVILPLPPPRERFALLELAAALQLADRVVPEGVLALGAHWEHGRGFVELAARGRLAASRSTRGGAGVVHEDEWTLGIGARAGWRSGRFSLGPGLDVGVTRASARGETPDGRRGDAQLAFLRLDFSLDLRWTLWDGPAPVQLCFAPALELDPAAQRFLLDSRSVLELGRVRAWLPLGLVVGLPLGGAP